ncbi:MAG: hypothetical protein A4E55_00256 [Pelotomaculum sp. PtaU1.Bin035]|nr:MAG: hypothetical protein A4E55_00256 [Pelotomaculum sp. PtaU1.Bin035]
MKTFFKDFSMEAGALVNSDNDLEDVIINRQNKHQQTVKRAVLDHVVMQLYALSLVNVSTEGKSKICSLTSFVILQNLCPSHLQNN